MRIIGLVFILAGLGTLVTKIMGINHQYLTMLDQWGDLAGWSIRGGILFIGLVLFVFLGKKKDISDQETIILK